MSSATFLALGAAFPSKLAMSFFVDSGLDAVGFLLGTDLCPAGDWLGKNRSDYRLDVGVSRKWLRRCLDACPKIDPMAPNTVVHHWAWRGSLGILRLTQNGVLPLAHVDLEAGLFSRMERGRAAAWLDVCHDECAIVCPGA
jgi:hypothetical protein